MQFIFYLALIIVATKAAGHLSVKLGQPAVLGKLIVGIIIGPAFLGWIQPDDFIDHFAEIGVLLLMFIAGLETDLDQLRQNWKSAFAVAIGGIILPFIGGYAVASGLGLSQSESLFLALLLCATSVSISVQALKELNQLNSKEGSTILGAAVVDDVVVVVLLAVMLSLLGTTESISIPALIGKKALFFVVVIAVSIWIIPLFMKLIAKLKVTEALMSGALVACFSFAYFAEKMGVAGIIGAFAAGIAISQTTFRHEVEKKVEPIAYTLFVPVFFVSIGLSITFDGLGNQLVFIIVLSLVAILSKLFGGGLGARLTGFNNRSSLAIGAGMVSRGEVALIISASGLESGLLPQNYFTAVVMVIMITTLVTPPMLKLIFPAAAEEKALKR
ncbi:monovalent cation:proton antiporter-2 (CPA2) family protein [Paenibacillus endophyticus]|uniref:Monovalent cation:proton antiporter-2 (CPA2) family protein n=1 Tax=Paenibacillus endophyticus TaxID=1294268 RepID=A0A7W5GBF2_9BACL|nr:cation:proton antiporter [Paenibacillus endophyticus]MBB3152892.1 monovalent cation:proton antiporter-2 (CPA2) family protein [Paenibacillus endophyticus]